MTERDRYIPGVPCWVDTSQPDPAAAAEFYGGLFGWDLADAMPPGSPGAYFMARLGGGVVAAVDRCRRARRRWPCGTPTYGSRAPTRPREGARGRRSVIAEPFDIFDSGRMAVFADPEGAVFGVWQPREHRGAMVVNEPGSLNFNDLHTRDPERAKAFYGAVFGWDTIDIGVGEMWTLAAYGDFLEARTPGNRASMADTGAPEGSRASSRASSRSRPNSPTRRRTGASRSPSPTPTRSPRAPSSSAGPWSSRRSMRRGCG